MVTETEPRQGFYSLVRWRADIARDEERNIGVLVVDPQQGGYLRPLPISSLSSKLRDQGILDAALSSLREQVEALAFDLNELRGLHEAYTRSLLVSEPQPVAVRDLEETVKALYRAFVAVRATGRSRTVTKGVLTDRIVDALRGADWTVKRGAYKDDFIFDVVVESAPGKDAPDVMGILSYDAPRKDWSPIEKDAGHFICGVQMLGLEGTATILHPSQDASSDAKRSHDRVLRMLDHADVPIADAATFMESGALGTDGVALTS